MGGEVAIEIKVVRHKRGEQWQGVRRFRLSAARKQRFTIGSGPSSDVRLDDDSVAPTHAEVYVDEAKDFFAKDLASPVGTYVLVDPSVELSQDEPTYLRFARTTLTARLVRGHDMS